MSVFFDKDRKHWKYEFNHQQKRYIGRGYATKREAMRAEAQRREEVRQQPSGMATEGTPIDTDFLELCNRRLDHVKHFNSESHFQDVFGHASGWVEEWGGLGAEQVTRDMIERYLLKRSRVSRIVANKELQYLRALFNFGIKKDLAQANPTRGLDFMPVEKRRRRIPPKDHVMKVISMADPDSQDYLWTILLTAARVNEVNALTWDEVDFENRVVTLWTRKKKGGNRESRQIPMTQKLFDILEKRHQSRDTGMPWVFWHTYWSRAEGRMVSGPYGNRQKLMEALCSKADVPYFRFHPFRHFTASLLDDMGVPIGVIQRILGHENRKTTEIYLHSVGESERKAMLKLDGLGLIHEAPSRKEPGPTNMHMEFWRRKVERPSRRALENDVATLGYSGAGRKYGVSDNAIRKWLKACEAGH